ncbi:MAG TPA: hypothetical protein VK742_21400 [Candidatus Sulfotelmatobacter sp.]|jgi:hypothetical protein|nr:hypothetical protein [Candidatus Sulfotelmatobacter sp.]
MSTQQACTFPIRSKSDEYRLWALVCEYASRLDFQYGGKNSAPILFTKETAGLPRAESRKSLLAE